MRPKSGLPKRRALRNKPEFTHGFRDNPKTADTRHPSLDGTRAQNGIDVLSLFSGCGGLDLGFVGGFQFGGTHYKSLPFQITKAIDSNVRAIDTYNLNLGNHGEVGDLTKIAASELPRCRVLIGGFPCQDFSSSGPKVGFDGDRGQLYRVLVDYMREHRPMVVVGENVPYLRRLRGGEYLRTIVREFESCGYDVDVWELYGPDYGLPQSRRRIFIVCTRNDLIGRPNPPVPTHARRHVAIDEAIGDLVGIIDETVTNQSQYFVATKATSGGGQGDHANKRGEVAYCIRANAKARIQFHYELPRRLTVRECARLQSFPDEFVFPGAAMTNMEQIGNAVAPLMGHVVASSVAEFLARVDRGDMPAAPSRRLHRQEELFARATNG